MLLAWLPAARHVAENECPLVALQTRRESTQGPKYGSGVDHSWMDRFQVLGARECSAGGPAGCCCRCHTTEKRVTSPRGDYVARQNGGLLHCRAATHQLGQRAQTWGRPQVPSFGVCFYEDIDFGGRYFCVRVGATSERVPSGTNDKISSIRIFGDATVTVYRDPNFGGRHVMLPTTSAI